MWRTSRIIALVGPPETSGRSSIEVVGDNRDAHLSRHDRLYPVRLVDDSSGTVLRNVDYVRCGGLALSSGRGKGRIGSQKVGSLCKASERGKQD